jgi:hypothetical protein
LLVDVVNEIQVDVTGLASTVGGVLKLPDVTIDAIADHILGSGAWFRFLERDPVPDPRLTRRTIERLRRPPGEALKRRLVCGLLPAVNARQAPVIAAPPPPPAPAQEDTKRLRDEMRLLAAAVEGLALRAAKI